MDVKTLTPNKLEKELISFLSEDCHKMPGEHEGEREKGFFTCAGSMFAILEAKGLTQISGYTFITMLDLAVSIRAKKSTH